MSQTRRERQQAATREEIKMMARIHMDRDGAAALSLRAIAADMGLSSAALYYYYPNRDALITALIIDALRALGSAIEAAVESQPNVPCIERLLAALLAYRAWAVAHPAEYTLVYSTPIPGYHAPIEITVNEMPRTLSVLERLFTEAWVRGDLRGMRVEGELPTTVVSSMTTWLDRSGRAIRTEVLQATLRTWSYCHGLISLELFGHLQPSLDDPTDFFQHEVQALLRRMGLAGKGI